MMNENDGDELDRYNAQKGDEKKERRPESAPGWLSFETKAKSGVGGEAVVVVVVVVVVVERGARGKPNRPFLYKLRTLEIQYPPPPGSAIQHLGHAQRNKEAMLPASISIL
jgi:hypothetical protein